VWVNQYGKGKVFGTTVGHYNETVSSNEYLNLLTNGLLWTCDKLTDEGKPAEGYGPGGK
jgi:type 1 glutamine amidotransferase